MLVFFIIMCGLIATGVNRIGPNIQMSGEDFPIEWWGKKYTYSQELVQNMPKGPVKFVVAPGANETATRIGFVPL